MKTFCDFLSVPPVNVDSLNRSLSEYGPEYGLYKQERKKEKLNDNQWLGLNGERLIYLGTKQPNTEN